VTTPIRLGVPTAGREVPRVPDSGRDGYARPHEEARPSRDGPLIKCGVSTC
jgi:hypothetical protein